AAYAAKSGVGKLVVRLKPVAECAPQHAGRGARRSAFQDKVFAIEKIGGVTAVERERLESGERSELGGSPLPTIAQHAVNTEGAAAFRKRIHRRGTPAGEIKIAACGIWSLFSPGIC